MRYCVMAIRLHYDFAFSHIAFILYRIVTASISYCSRHIGPVIASYSYCSDVIDQHYHIYSLVACEENSF
jgi:hypothetical protein